MTTTQARYCFCTRGAHHGCRLGGCRGRGHILCGRRPSQFAITRTPSASSSSNPAAPAGTSPIDIASLGLFPSNWWSLRKPATMGLRANQGGGRSVWRMWIRTSGHRAGHSPPATAVPPSAGGGETGSVQLGVGNPNRPSAFFYRGFPPWTASRPPQLAPGWLPSRAASRPPPCTAWTALSSCFWDAYLIFLKKFLFDFIFSGIVYIFWLL
jgi:hypothetical protein